MLNQSDCLNNWFVLPVNISGALSSGEAMTQTELSSSHVLVSELLHDLDEMSPDSSVQLNDGVVEGGSKSSGGKESKIKE